MRSTRRPPRSTAPSSARGAVDERLPDRSQQATLRSLGDERLRDLVQQFIDAFEHGEVDAILAMLAEDATFAMPPTRTGSEAATHWPPRGSCQEGPGRQLRLVPTTANGQLALGAYRLDSGRYVAIALDVLTLEEARITGITAFRAPALFPRFGLPEELLAHH